MCEYEGVCVCVQSMQICVNIVKYMSLYSVKIMLIVHTLRQTVCEIECVFWYESDNVSKIINIYSKHYAVI